MSILQPLLFDTFRHSEMIQLERTLSQATQEFKSRKEELKMLCQQQEQTKYRDKITSLLIYNTQFFNSFIAKHSQARLQWEQNQWRKSQRIICKEAGNGEPTNWEQQALHLQREYRWWDSKRLPRQIRSSNRACVKAYFAKFRAEQALKANHDYYVALDSLNAHNQQAFVPPAIQQALQHLMTRIQQEKTKSSADIYALTQALLKADALFNKENTIAPALNLDNIDRMPGGKDELFLTGLICCMAYGTGFAIAAIACFPTGSIFLAIAAGFFLVASICFVFSAYRRSVAAQLDQVNAVIRHYADEQNCQRIIDQLATLSTEKPELTAIISSAKRLQDPKLMTNLSCILTQIESMLAPEISAGNFKHALQTISKNALKDAELQKAIQSFATPLLKAAEERDYMTNLAALKAKLESKPPLSTLSHNAVQDLILEIEQLKSSASDNSTVECNRYLQRALRLFEVKPTPEKPKFVFFAAKAKPVTNPMEIKLQQLEQSLYNSLSKEDTEQEAQSASAFKTAMSGF